MEGYIAEEEKLGLEGGVFNCDVADWKEQKIGGSHRCDIDLEVGEGETRLSCIKILEEEAVVEGIIIDSEGKGGEKCEIAGERNGELLINHRSRCILVQFDVTGIDVAGRNHCCPFNWGEEDGYGYKWEHTGR